MTQQVHGVSCLQSEPDVVPQTDLVPTLALLLGVPIPYSSVGQVLLPLFPSHRQTDGAAGGLSQLEALWINAKQVGLATDCLQTAHSLSMLRHVVFVCEGQPFPRDVLRDGQRHPS